MLWHILDDSRPSIREDEQQHEKREPIRDGFVAVARVPYPSENLGD